MNTVDDRPRSGRPPKPELMQQSKLLHKEFAEIHFASKKTWPEK